MGEIDYSPDNGLIKEKSLLKEDLYTGNSLEILILLLKGEKTANEIARHLDIPIFSVHLYLGRLLKFNLIKESKIINEEKTIEKVYQLLTSQLDIIDNKRIDKENESDTILECQKVAEQFSKLSAHAIENIYKYAQQPYTIKSSFICGNPEKMRLFKERLDLLIDEFNALEELNEEITFGLIVNFTPFEYPEDMKISI